MPSNISITLTPIRPEGFASRTWYEETRFVSAADFRGTMPMEDLQAIFTDAHSQIIMTFGEKEVHLTFRSITPVVVDGAYLRSDDVFAAQVGIENVLQIGTEEFRVETSKS